MSSHRRRADAENGRHGDAVNLSPRLSPSLPVLAHLNESGIPPLCTAQCSLPEGTVHYLLFTVHCPKGPFTVSC